MTDLFIGSDQPGLPGVENQLDGHVQISSLARILDLSEREIQNLAKDGDIPASIGGQYHLVNCSRAYIRKLRDAAAGRAKSADREAVEMRKLLAQAEQEENTARRMKGEVAELDMIRREWENLLVTYKTRSRLIPRKVVQELTDIFLRTYGEHIAADVPEGLRQTLHVDIENRLGEEIDEALTDLSNYDPEKIIAVQTGIKKNDSGDLAA